MSRDQAEGATIQLYLTKGIPSDGFQFIPYQEAAKKEVTNLYRKKLD